MKNHKDCNSSGIFQFHYLSLIKHTNSISGVYSKEDPTEISYHPKVAYENRKEKSEKRINKVLDYSNEDHICRSRMLLSYFGEKGTKNCNNCDICRQKEEISLSNDEFDSLRELLIKTLTEPIEIITLADSLPYSKEKNIAAIRFLADNDELFIIENGILSLKEQKLN